jgi:predicted RNA polymerase sigma factor
VLYLIFTEGHTSSAGPDLTRPDLTAEAIRLTRDLRALLPGEGEVAGLLALMLLTDAHREARLDGDGALVTLDRQDRARWDGAMIAEGIALVTGALAAHDPGPYLVQAAIAAVHAEAPSAGETDWPQIVALYGLLERLAPGPMVALNRAGAIAMVEGPRAGLERLRELERDERLAGHLRLVAMRAHLLERAGERAAAAEAYRAAAGLTTSEPERRHLEAQAGRMGAAGER